MSVSVAKIAQSLNKDESEILELFAGLGITVVDTKAPLQEKYLVCLQQAIQQIKETPRENMEIRKRSIAHMEDLIKTNKVFIDTCSLLLPAFPKFIMEFEKLLVKHDSRLIVPNRVVDELKKHSKNATKPELAKTSLEMLQMVSDLQQRKIIEIRGEETDNFADNVFNAVFSKHRLKHRLLLITQDNALAEDTLHLNKMKSVKGFPVSVKRINQYGYLSNFKFFQDEDFVPTFKRPKQEVTSPVIQKFSPARQVTHQNKSEVIPVKMVPQEGDRVFSSNGEIRLGKCLATGGEGSVYLTSTPYVCKIYKKEKIDTNKLEKIKLMLSQKIDYPGICWPIEIIYNENKEFVGYLMAKATGKELQKCLFVKPLLLKNFPHWKKRDTIELCLTILDKIMYLHERNIILGDINPMNILVLSPKEVYFVDTDSYQVEGFPCPVGTVNYTAPEIQRKDFSKFLRTIGNENFAVATLLFMIMLPGKPPYSQQGGENPVDNILQMDFSYPFGEQSNKKTPDGPWRYIWSHMSYDIKKIFYATFRKDGEHSSADTRLTAKEWHGKMSYYLECMDNGKMTDKDPMSGEIFPTRFKKVAGLTYVKCRLCNKDIAEEHSDGEICKECLNKGEEYECSRCGKSILYSNYLKYIKKGKRYDKCPDCFESLNEIHSSIRCVSCGSKFTMTNSEYEYYCDKGLSIPKRCKSCRGGKRQTSSFGGYDRLGSNTANGNSSNSFLSFLKNLFN